MKRLQFNLRQCLVSVFFLATACALWQLPAIGFRHEMDPLPLVPRMASLILAGAGVGVLFRTPCLGAVLLPIAFLVLFFIAAWIGIV